MPGHSHDDERPAQGFDPARHRREIELMEQRFRERAGRSGGGPISTGEIDARVQDEMQQFFTESHDQLEKVVPNLAEQEDHAMKETTGEIRRKIDDFFAQVTPDDQPAQPQAPPPASRRTAADPRPGTREIGVPGGPPPRPRTHTGPISRPVGPPPSQPIGTLPNRRVGPPPRPRDQYPGTHGVAAGRQDAPPASGPPPRRSGGPPPRPAGFQPEQVSTPFGSGGTMRSRSSAQAERPRLDLKTALAKLRGEEPAEAPAQPPRRPEPMRRREPQPEPPPAAAAPAPPPPPPAPPPRPEPPQERAPEPGRMIQPPTTTRPPESRPAFASPKIQPPSDDMPPELDRFAYRPEAPVRRPSERPRTESLPPMPELPGRRQRVELSSSEVPVEPIKARIRKSSDLPPPPKAPPRPDDARRTRPRAEAPLPPPPAARRPEPSPQPPAEAQPGGADPAGSFDEIFSEVQSLVLDSLKGSVTETFGVAQELSNEMSEEISTRISQRISEVAVRAAEAARAKARNEAQARELPIESETPRPAAARPSQDEENAAARGYAGKFAAPSDEDEDVVEEVEEAPPAPYDWGVKKKAQPKGAWLLDAEESKSDDEDDDDAEDESDAGGGGGGGGARGYLLRKLGQEVEDLMPAIDALQRKNVVSDQEAAELKGEEPEDEFDDDAELSVESFQDNRARAEAADGMTPMKLVEQLRNVKRLQELLISKGLIGEDDLLRPPEE